MPGKPKNAVGFAFLQRMSKVTPKVQAASSCLPADKMTVPAFLAHTTLPKASIRVAPAFWHHGAPSAVAGHIHTRNLPTSRRRVWALRLSDNFVDAGGEENAAVVGVRWEEPTLEETFDAIDDVMMDRLPGEGRDKVKVFGAWLDADVAGRKAGQGNRAAGLVARAERGDQLTNREKAEVIYEDAISVMRGGDYDASFTLLEEAVSLAGADSRRGGEFKLWAVQALQGVGRNKQAVALLESLKAHRDLDVRKVSQELLYIAKAPQLKLGEDDFVQFPDVSHMTETFDKTKWKEIGKPKVVLWKKEKKDDLGYYVGSDTGQAPGNDPVMLVACVGAILALSFVFLG